MSSSRVVLGVKCHYFGPGNPRQHGQRPSLEISMHRQCPYHSGYGVDRDKSQSVYFGDKSAGRSRKCSGKAYTKLMCTGPKKSFSDGYALRRLARESALSIGTRQSDRSRPISCSSKRTSDRNSARKSERKAAGSAGFTAR